MNTQVRSKPEINPSRARGIDLKLEVVAIPVSDIDRAKQFYSRLGWRLDADFVGGDNFRGVQFTPPGSPASIHFGKGVTSAAPGSAQGLFLVVSDIEAARAELVGRGVDVGEIFPRCRPGTSADPRPGSGAAQLFLVRLIQGSGRQHLAAAGSHRAFSRTRGCEPNDVLFGGRPGERAPPRGGRTRRAREANRRAV